MPQRTRRPRSVRGVGFHFYVAPTKYFLCNLPQHYTLRRLVRIVKSRWKIE